MYFSRPSASSRGSELILLSQMISLASFRVVVSAGAVTSFSYGVMNSFTFTSVLMRLTR